MNRAEDAAFVVAIGPGFVIVALAEMREVSAVVNLVACPGDVEAVAAVLVLECSLVPVGVEACWPVIAGLWLGLEGRTARSCE